VEKILLDAQLESGRSSSKSSHRPHGTLTGLLRDTHSTGEKSSPQSEEDYTERRKEVEDILKKNSYWI
jgi:BCL2/adenovirus E1B protein-interacting protein 3